jgi:hypothetical protein
VAIERLEERGGRLGEGEGHALNSQFADEIVDPYAMFRTCSLTPCGIHE